MSNTERDDSLHRLRVKEWAKEDRPREKLMMKGPEALSNAELLAILIGSGNSNETAVDLMKRMLRDNKDSLAMLGKMSIQDMMKYNGIGEAKAITLLAACELGKRRQQSSMPEVPKLDNPQNIYNLMHPIMRDLKVEESYVLLLKTNFQLIFQDKTLTGRFGRNSRRCQDGTKGSPVGRSNSHCIGSQPPQWQYKAQPQR